mmetsp:Transcript_97222/g.275038  ORF Transcript_97222/g.275038 Transcript_97222/m.275038 type:complete len:291 (+) Transcript_97222:574-1446(+)
MGFEHKVEEHAVDGHQEDRADARNLKHGTLCRLRHVSKHGRKADADGGHQLAAHVRGRALGVELLGLAHRAGGEDGHPEHQQQVREDGAQQVALHHLDQALLHCLDAHDHLHGVAEGRVQQASDQLARVARERLRGLAEDARQGDDREEVHGKDDAAGQSQVGDGLPQWHQDEGRHAEFVREDLLQRVALRGYVPSPDCGSVLAVRDQGLVVQRGPVITVLQGALQGIARQHLVPFANLLTPGELELLVKAKLLELFPFDLDDLHQGAGSDCGRPRLVGKQGVLAKVVPC